MHRMALAAVVLLSCLLPLGCGGDLRSVSDTAVEVNDLSGRLPGGKEWTAQYYFDRRALAATVLSGDTLVALTASGNLLTIDAEHLNITAELVPTVPAVCLGTGPDGEVLAGLADGAIGAVELPGLELAPFGRVKGYPVWVGTLEGRLAAGRFPDLPEAGPNTTPLLVGIVGEEPVEVSEAVRLCPRCWFVDSRGRLLIGEDHGEFGGKLHVFDPATGDVTTRGRWPGGIRRIAEDNGGRVFVVGGMIHMSSRFGFAARVTGTSPRPVGLWNLDLPGTGPWTEVSREGGPEWPITTLVPELDAWLSMSGGTLFRVSADFGEWDPLLELELRVSYGYAAMGSSPPLVAMHRRSDGTLLLSTIRDGVIAVDPASGEIRIVTGEPQLELCRASWVRSAYGVAVVADHSLGRDPWVLERGRFRRHPVEPEDDADKGGWDRLVHPLPGGRMVSLWGSPSEARLAWWLGSEVERREVRSGVGPNHICFSPDGLNETTGRDPKVVLGPGERWCIVSRDWRRRGQPLIGLGSVPRDAAGEPIEVRDAAWLDEDSLLLATEAGLLLCDADTAETGPFPIEFRGEEEIRYLCRDGAGRIWLSGNRLWLLPESGAAPVATDAVPLLESPRICALAADPDDPRAVLVGFETRGLLRLRIP